MTLDSFNQTFKSPVLGQSLKAEISGDEEGIPSKAFYDFVHQGTPIPACIISFGGGFGRGSGRSSVSTTTWARMG